MKVRIKTEEEFIREFDVNWREDISDTWSFQSEMDYLFGKEIILNKSQIKQYNKDKTFDVSDSEGKIIWTISERMFKIILTDNNDLVIIDPSMISCQNIFCESYGKHYNLNCSKVWHLSNICNVKSCEALKKFIEYFSNN